MAVQAFVQARMFLRSNGRHSYGRGIEDTLVNVGTAPYGSITIPSQDCTERYQQDDGGAPSLQY